ncbi:MAG: Nif11-like leader peptide family natural product precursor [Coriobacteriales bacterium]|nr:Nif11-like leader peptide family natural product precursor [Coriobacteriales bacterium]
MNFEEHLSQLSPELQEKARACKTPEELLALAQEEGYELSDDELASIAGGKKWYDCDAVKCYHVVLP